MGVAVLAAAAGGALSVPAAAEDTPPTVGRPGQVEFPTQCLPPQEAGLPPADGPTTARIGVHDPAPRVGDTVTVTYRVAATPAVNPTGAALPTEALTATGRVLLGGAQSGEVTVTGRRPREHLAAEARAGDVPAGAPLPAVTMTGTFTVTAPGAITLAPGAYTLHTSHPVDLDTGCTAAAPAPVAERLTAAPLPTANLRHVLLATAHGRPGDTVRAAAAGFPPGASVTVAGRAGAAETADRTTATADALGAVLVRLPVTDRATTAIVAYEGGAWSPGRGSSPAAYAVVDPAPPLPPPGTHVLTAAPEPGALGMTQAGERIALGTVPYGAGGAAPGRIGTVTVTDTRGGPAGWSLTGKVTDFTGPGGVRIPGASLSWTPACTVGAGGRSPCAAGSAGPVGPEGAVLASGPDAAPAGGTFTIDAEVTLQVPRFTPPGAYAAVLTLTLS